MIRSEGANIHPAETANLVKQFKKEYPVVLGQDVIWGDMDAFGHINNTVYFRYFEDARIAYFDKIGVHEQKEQFDLGPILAKTLCNFRMPLDYPDRIHIATRSSILSPKKFNISITADGEGLIVYYDYANGKSCEIPEAIVAAIKVLER